MHAVTITPDRTSAAVRSYYGDEPQYTVQLPETLEELSKLAGKEVTIADVIAQTFRLDIITSFTDVLKDTYKVNPKAWPKDAEGTPIVDKSLRLSDETVSKIAADVSAKVPELAKDIFGDAEKRKSGRDSKLATFDAQLAAATDPAIFATLLSVRGMVFPKAEAYAGPQPQATGKAKK